MKLDDEQDCLAGASSYLAVCPTFPHTIKTMCTRHFDSNLERHGSPRPGKPAMMPGPPVRRIRTPTLKGVRPRQGEIWRALKPRTCPSDQRSDFRGPGSAIPEALANRERLLCGGNRHRRQGMCGVFVGLRWFRNMFCDAARGRRLPYCFPTPHFGPVA